MRDHQWGSPSEHGINYEYRDLYAMKAGSGWALRGRELQVGDIVHIAGVYKRRTLWQWLTRQSRVLQTWIVR